MNEQKVCWNCLHEYQCDWSQAGDHSSCKEWVEEHQEGEDAGNQKIKIN